MSPAAPRCLHPVFAWGTLASGGPLSWALPVGPGGQGRSPARVRGRLWRLPSGALALELDPHGTWVQGELGAPMEPERLRLVETLLGADSLGLVREVVPVLCQGRTVRAVTWGASPSSLRLMGATSLRTGDPARFPPAWKREPQGMAPVAPSEKRGYPTGPTRPPGWRSGSQGGVER